MEVSPPVPVGSIKYTDVVRKFKEIKTNYYSERGCMISTLNDNFSKQFLKNDKFGMKPLILSTLILSRFNNIKL